MKKNDLKEGMILELRDGTRFLFLGERMIGDDAWDELENYNDDLTSKEYRILDIIKVYKIGKCLRMKDVLERIELIWEKEEWIEVDFFRAMEELKGGKSVLSTYRNKDDWYEHKLIDGIIKERTYKSDEEFYECGITANEFKNKWKIKEI